MTHGWPGSVVEFTEVIGPLTDPKRTAATRPTRSTWCFRRFPATASPAPPASPAGTWPGRPSLGRAHGRLGYGGTARRRRLGLGRSRELGLGAPGHVAGVHVNMLISSGSADDAGLTDGRSAARPEPPVPRHGMGYGMIQSTRPQTLAYGADGFAGGPARLDRGEVQGVDRRRPARGRGRPGQMLTNVTLYWLTRNGRVVGPPLLRGRASGAWGPPRPVDRCPPAWPCSRYEIAPPSALGRADQQHRALVGVRRGGHFAAMEEPDLLTGDVRDFFRQLR